MKDFTRVLVLQHIESKIISLDDTLDRFNLGFSKDVSSKITVEHLLMHRSGFADIFNAEYRENPLKFDTLEKKLQLLIDEPLLFEPGTNYHYTNYGYIVLGRILEQASNKAFQTILEDNIFAPLDLSQTSFTAKPNSPNQSLRYTYLYNDTLKKVTVHEHPGPDGGIESTVFDIQKFYHSLFNDDNLVNRNSSFFQTIFNTPKQQWKSYGGGLGISAAVEVDLENDLEIIVLANADNLVAERISGRIMNYIQSGKYQKIVPRAQNLAYRYYQDNGTEYFYKNFKDYYIEKGYEQFIGRVINDLGMQLLNNNASKEALDIFSYLVYLFPKAPQAYDSLAYGYFVSGEEDKAKTTFNHALKLSPSFNSDYSSNNYNVENKYLGQTPPGNTPKLFAPGLVNTENYTYGAAFNQPMNEFHFLRIPLGRTNIEHAIYKYDDYQWQLDKTSEAKGQPFFSPDGKLMHLGRRYKEFTGQEWTETKDLGSSFNKIRIMRMTSSLKGTFVFDEVGSPKGDGVLRYSTLNNGKRSSPKAFDSSINAGSFSAHPFIAPDESYLLWDTRREDGFGDSDIYISFRQADGSWGEAINLGNKINTSGWDAAASVSPDGKYLFFHRLNEAGNANIYWVSAEIIDSLRN
jgi:hypothetical protein